MLCRRVRRPRTPYCAKCFWGTTYRLGEHYLCWVHPPASKTHVEPPPCWKSWSLIPLFLLMTSTYREYLPCNMRNSLTLCFNSRLCVLMPCTEIQRVKLI